MFRSISRFPTALHLLISFMVIANYSAISCDRNNGTDNVGYSDNWCNNMPATENPCESLNGSFQADEECKTAYKWGFSSTKECADIIQAYLDSPDACDQAAGNCLNTMIKNGVFPAEDDPGHYKCGVIAPQSCESAWWMWNDCLALTDSEDC